MSSPAVDLGRPSLAEIAREWGRIGCVGFGGPPAHITLLRQLCVTRRRWLSEPEFERAIAASNLLPGPASTQLAIYCAWTLRGTRGALVGGLGFIVPGLVAILALSAALLAGQPPTWLRAAGAGAGAAVPAVALDAGLAIARPMSSRVAGDARARALAYGLAGAVAGALAPMWLVLVLLGCGLAELVARGAWRALASLQSVWVLASVAAPGGALALAWTSLKVGALAFGGGFVIVPLMQADAVQTYHWMTHSQFLYAVALGQVTPGPVTHTIAAVGYAAGGLAGGLLAALVAFAPSFAFIVFGAARFERLTDDRRVRAFLGGAAPCAAGAIIGSALPLASALAEGWQFALLGACALALLVLRRGVVATLLLAGAAGACLGLLGAPTPG